MKSHLLGDDAFARILELRHVRPGFARNGLRPARSNCGTDRQLAGLQPVVFRPALAALIFLDVAARQNPIAAQRGQALVDVDRRADRPYTDRMCHRAAPAARRPTAPLRGTARRPRKSFCEPGKRPARDRRRDWGCRIGLFMQPLPTPVLTGSGSKGPARCAISAFPETGKAPLGCAKCGPNARAIQAPLTQTKRKLGAERPMGFRLTHSRNSV